LGSSILKIWQIGKLHRTTAGLSLLLIAPTPALALPPPTDLPEEYLRTKLIFEARSPLDGEVLTAGEYNDLTLALEKERQAEIADSFVSQRYPQPPNTPRDRNTRIQYPKDDPNSLDSVDYSNSPNYKEVLFLLRLRKIGSFFGITINPR
jgi:hypothetical protein